ncbi:MAG: hypothetical protein V2G41_10070, partial [bacterium JZ-2024 1]
MAEDTTGAVRLTPKRAFHINIRNDSGVELATAANPIRIDPTGTTAQPISDGGGSITVDTPQLPASLVSGRLDVNIGASITLPVDQINAAKLDYDTGAGVQDQVVFGIALPGAGGPVAGGTATNPIRIDPTGTTAQPISDGGGSITVDTPQLPASLVSGRLDVNIGASITLPVDQINAAKLDYDTGAGVQDQVVFGIALPGAG